MMNLWARSGVSLAFAALASTCAVGQAGDLLLNELDCDQSGTDGSEFVEIRSPAGGESLADVFLVHYNGNAAGDTAYRVVALGGHAVPGDGLFVVGSALVPGVDLVAYTSNGVQNGADGLALFRAPGLTAGDFEGTPAAAPPVGAVLLDALVYDTSDPDDAALLAALTPGQQQADEDGLGQAELHALQRPPDAQAPFAGGAWFAAPPSAGAANAAPFSGRIHDVQGAAHRSPVEDRPVTGLYGVVTAVGSSGFWMQDDDDQADADEATSEALYVRTVSPPGLSAGDAVEVAGMVVEHRPGNVATNLTITEVQAPTVTLLASGQALPAPVVLGVAGRLPPSEIIDDDTIGGDVEVGPTLFDPASDGLDFYESLEGMRVQVDDALVVGPTSVFGEIPVVGDLGAQASGLNARGGITLSQGDANPERVVLDDGLASTPTLGVGDRLPGAALGVLHYSYGAFKLKVTDLPAPQAGGTGTEVAASAAPGLLSVASFNVKNLHPGSDPARFAALGERIAVGLAGPDLVGLEEVQDDSGPTQDGVTSAQATWSALAAAVAAAGGPAYSFVDIAPLDGQDGGQPGGNIRCGFLYRTDRGLQLVSRPGGDALTATQPVLGPGGISLTFSPGRVDPAHAAFASSRKPLAAEFRFHGQPLVVVVNHFKSKSGDDPLFGPHQPPLEASTAKRQAQGQVVGAFAASILALDPDAAVVVLGDLNDFAFAPPVQALQASGLALLTDLLPESERYSYLYQGNSQALDHVLVSPALAAGAAYRGVHGLGAHRHGASAHDPCLARLRVPGAPWSDLGAALPGAAGPPRLDGVGGLQPGSAGGLYLSGAAAVAPGLWFASDTAGNAPFKGGTLVPWPLRLQLPLLTQGDGAASLTWTAWPAGLPAGGTLVLQAWVADASALAGAAASNALLAELP